MSTLEDDIARIAALRGRTVADVLASAEAHKRKLPIAVIDTILHPTSDSRADLEFFDALPADSRAFLREHEKMLNAVAWAGALEAGYDEALLIEAVEWRLRKA